MRRPVKNSIGRWEVAGHEFTSGDLVRVMIGKIWFVGRVEFLHGAHSGYVVWIDDLVYIPFQNNLEVEIAK